MDPEETPSLITTTSWSAAVLAVVYRPTGSPRVPLRTFRCGDGQGRPTASPALFAWRPTSPANSMSASRISARSHHLGDSMPDCRGRSGPAMGLPAADLTPKGWRPHLSVQRSHAACGRSAPSISFRRAAGKPRFRWAGEPPAAGNRASDTGRAQPAAICRDVIACCVTAG